uniref:Uncharacterized protein n=1 Tax=Nonomuraea gerenzanensis TaxID=93944 RepID=A0A1M4EF51_9ACTN|nr:hypothetical protein BN4615_P6946 [Nonomuraea gerenzanensis]
MQWWPEWFQGRMREVVRGVDGADARGGVRGDVPVVRGGGSRR